MTDVRTWSKTPLENSLALPHGAPENMPYSGVNDVIRQNMAEVARWHERIHGILTTGDENNYIIAIPETNIELPVATGFGVAIRADKTNTGDSSLTINHDGATVVASIYTPNGEPLEAGAILDGNLYRLFYAGSHWVVVDATVVPVPAVKTDITVVDATSNGVWDIPEGLDDITSIAVLWQPRLFTNLPSGVTTVWSPFNPVIENPAVGSSSGYIPTHDTPNYDVPSTGRVFFSLVIVGRQLRSVPDSRFGTFSRVAYTTGARLPLPVEEE